MDPATRDAVREGCRLSAATVLPIVFAYLRSASWAGAAPPALLDVGAGEGWWTDAAQDLGVGRFCTLDSDGAMGVTNAWDAEQMTSLPWLPLEWGVSGTWERWPLALCLEVAEHVTPAAGDHLVRELCRVADAVLWSAAIPGQTGDGHINEQWPAYWQERFLDHGYMLTDPFRDRLWEQADVEPWYRQNLLLAIPVPHRGDVDLRPPRALIDPVTWAYHRGVAYP